MGEYAFGSVVVDEVLIGGQEEQAPVDAAPAAQESAEPDASQPVSGGTNKTGITVNNGTASKNCRFISCVRIGYKIRNSRTKLQSCWNTTTGYRSTRAGKIRHTCKQSGWHGDRSGQSKVPAESKASVSANDRQQFHVPNQETQTNGDKTAKSGNSSGKNGSGETAKQERKAQEQPSVWQDTAETTGKEKTEGGEETEEKTGGPLLPGFIILCIVLLLTGSICLIRDNNIDLKK